MTYEIDKKGNITEVQPKKKVLLRDFLKDISQRYFNFKSDLARVIKIHEVEIKDIKSEMVDCEKLLKKIHLDENILKKLQQDRNAYNTMNKAFPDIFPIKKVSKPKKETK